MLVEWILADGLPVRLGLQLHKFVWTRQPRAFDLRVKKRRKEKDNAETQRAQRFRREECRKQGGGIEERFEERFTQSRVLLSGGMDSCVSTAIAREGHGASNIALLHASYGQLTQERERRAFDDIANFYGVRERLAVQLDHFRAIGGSALTDKSIPFRKTNWVRRPAGSAIPVTYVPFRNAHFLSVAVSWAEAIGAEQFTSEQWRKTVQVIRIAGPSITARSRN